MSSVAVFFVQALIVVCVPYWVWRLLGLRGYVPLVVMQILTGILLGPSALGRVAPELWSMLFSGPALTGMVGPSWLAVVIFAFLTGLHLQPDELRSSKRCFTMVSLAGILVPVTLGVVAGYGLLDRYPDEIGAHAQPWQFAASMGLAMGVTALPVLASILRETGLLRHRLGHFTLGAAAINDAALWVMVAFLLLTLPTHGSPLTGMIFMPLASMVYVAVMLMWLRPLLARGVGGVRRLSERGLVKVCAVIFTSAVVAELIGLHAVLGGFLAGVIVPRIVARPLITKLEPLTVVVLLPFFFTLAGLKTSLDVSSSHLLEIIVVTTGLSILGKVGGTMLAARWLGERWAESLALGILMQTKGMMEVVVLAIFLEAQVISTTTFSALLFMALTTTALTMPLLRLSLRFFPLADPASQMEEEGMLHGVELVKRAPRRVIPVALEAVEEEEEEEEVAGR